MKFARIEENRVTETFETASHETLKVAFHPDIAALFTACPDDVQPGWLFENGVYSEPDVTPLLPSKQNLLDYAADKRWQMETGGILFNGVPIATDRDSQAMIGRTLQVMELTGKSIQFKTQAGFIEMDLNTIKHLSLTIAAHVQVCFDAEAEVSEKIGRGDIFSFEQIENYEWPSNT